MSDNSLDQDQLDTLRKRVVYLNGSWQIYKQLFIDNQEIGLLIKSAPSFWHITGLALWESIVLDICALGDNAADIRGNKNLSLKYFCDEVSYQKLDQTEIDQLKCISDDYCKIISGEMEPSEIPKGLSGLRNKLIAHWDFQHTLEAEPVFDLKRGNKEIDKCLILLSSFYNLLAKELVQEETLLEPIEISGGGNDIIQHIRNSKKLLENESRARKVTK